MQWTTIKPISKVRTDLPTTLADIESHMPANHQYRSNRKVTWAHETTHGLNSRIRGGVIELARENDEIIPMKIEASNDVNACYVLQDRAIILGEPDTKLSMIATNTPQSLRGMSFELYLKSQQRYWENEPLYVLDEWSAYTNGLSTALDTDGGDGQYSDALQSLEFMGYSLVLLQIHNPEEELRDFVKWQTVRTIALYNKSKNTSLHSNKQESYINSLLTSNDTADLRSAISNICGSNWLENTINGVDEDNLGLF